MEMVRIMTTSFTSHLSVLPVFFSGTYHKAHLVRWSEYRGLDACFWQRHMEKLNVSRRPATPRRGDRPRTA